MKFRATVEFNYEEFEVVSKAACVFETGEGMSAEQVRAVSKLSGEDGPTLTMDLEAVRSVYGSLCALHGRWKAGEARAKTEADYTNVTRAMQLLHAAKTRLEPCNVAFDVDEHGFPRVKD